MAEYVDVMKTRRKMCRYYSNLKGCTEYCPIGKRIHGDPLNRAMDCYTFMSASPEKAQDIIMEWAKEHAAKTNADKFKEVFGFSIDPLYYYCPISFESRDCYKNDDIRCSNCDKSGFWEKEYKEPKE